MKLVIVSTLGAVHRYVISEVARRFPPALVIQPVRPPPPSGGAREPSGTRPLDRLERALHHRVRSLRMERTEAALERSLGVWGRPPVDVTRVAFSDLHSSATLDAIRALAPDVMLVSGAPILRPELFSLPRLGAVNVHYGIAPAYRGEDTLFWPLVKGDHESLGVTLHRIDRAIDTGSILAHGFVGRSGGEGETELWAAAARLGARLVLRLLETAGEGLPAGAVQPAGGRQYFRRERTLAWEARYWGRRAVGLSPPPADERIVMYPEPPPSAGVGLSPG